MVEQGDTEGVAAALSRSVMSRSSGLGSRRPEGWSCATITAQARSVMGSA